MWPQELRFQRLFAVFISIPFVLDCFYLDKVWIMGFCISESKRLNYFSNSQNRSTCLLFSPFCRSHYSMSSADARYFVKSVSHNRRMRSFHCSMTNGELYRDSAHFNGLLWCDNYSAQWIHALAIDSYGIGIGHGCLFLFFGECGWVQRALIVEIVCGLSIGILQQNEISFAIYFRTEIFGWIDWTTWFWCMQCLISILCDKSLFGFELTANVLFIYENQ